MTKPDSTRSDVLERDKGLWDRVRPAIEDGSLDRKAWIEALREEHALAKQDPRIDLEAMLLQGLKLAFIADVDEAAELLKG